MREKWFSRWCYWKFKVFWGVMPCRLVNRYQFVNGSQRLHFWGEAVSVFVECLILKLKTMRSAEIFVTTYQSTRQNIPEDFSLQTSKAESEFRELTSTHSTFIYVHACSRKEPIVQSRRVLRLSSGLPAISIHTTTDKSQYQQPVHQP